jgi:hypothetical protein
MEREDVAKYVHLADDRNALYDINHSLASDAGKPLRHRVS